MLFLPISAEHRSSAWVHRSALHRSTLEQVGGLEGLSDYLVEDYEMGRRIWGLGKKIAILPYFVDTMVDLKTPAQWWEHQVYWDQNTRAARPAAFFSTALIRSVPLPFCIRQLECGMPKGCACWQGPRC